MARRSRQQQRPGAGKSNVGQAQASVSNIYIFLLYNTYIAKYSNCYNILIMIRGKLDQSSMSLKYLCINIQEVSTHGQRRQFQYFDDLLFCYIVDSMLCIWTNYICVKCGLSLQLLFRRSLCLSVSPVRARQQKFEDTKGIIRSRKSRKNNTIIKRKMAKRINNDIQNNKQRD